MTLKQAFQLKPEPVQDTVELRGEKMLLKNVVQEISIETCYLSPGSCLLLM